MSGCPGLLFPWRMPPYPFDDGLWNRTYHVMRLVARDFDLTALCFERMSRSTNDAPFELVGVG